MSSKAAGNGCTCQGKMGHRKATGFQRVYDKTGLMFVTFHPFIEDYNDTKNVALGLFSNIF